MVQAQLSIDTRVRAAQSEQITTAAARILAKDDEVDVRVVLATNESMCDPTVLSWLAKDISPLVRESVARHPEIDADEMATDKDWRVRASAGANRFTSPSVLIALLEDEEETVRECTRLNPSCPEPELQVAEVAYS